MRFSIVVVNYRLQVDFVISTQFKILNCRSQFQIQNYSYGKFAIHASNCGEEVYIFMFPRKCTFFILTQVFHHQWTILQLSLKVENLNSIFGITKTNIMLFLLFKVKCNKDIYKYGTTFSLISHNVMFIGP